MHGAFAYRITRIVSDFDCRDVRNITDAPRILIRRYHPVLSSGPATFLYGSLPAGLRAARGRRPRPPRPCHPSAPLPLPARLRRRRVVRRAGGYGVGGRGWARVAGPWGVGPQATGSGRRGPGSGWEWRRRVRAQVVVAVGGAGEAASVRKYTRKLAGARP